jgi:hypothetical protein
LMNLVRQGQGQSDEHHEPLKALFQSLGSEVAKWSTAEVEDEAELYPLLYTPSKALQKTAFDILHRVIPAAQEQVSFDAALEKKAAKLPEELLSLLLSALVFLTSYKHTFTVGNSSSITLPTPATRSSPTMSRPCVRVNISATC